MIGEPRKPLSGLWKGMSQKVGGLLAGFHRECPVCRSSSSGASNPLGLCASCFGKIPWITEIHCDTCGRYETCPDCRRRRDTAFTRNRSAVRYDPVMKQWLALFKYRGDERLLQLFADMLVLAYRKHGEHAELQGGGFDLLTYVPLSEQRLLERGFNQAEQLALRLGHKTGVRVLPLLTRTRHTPKQSFQKRAERLSNLEGAFDVDSSLLEKLTSAAGSGNRLRIAIVDDVYTTGTTLQHCSSLLARHVQASFYGITWAR
ncbi:ComF family protein [Paenibacillus sp. MBLB4367]|uniref:ComF family protein n=1 Tax=Paenibacillus sp. MBLB4367 TaxID=3384767 RepID=UPI0039080F2D